MRKSIAAVALIRRTQADQMRYLAQWNPKWRRYNCVAGHKREAESFRECMLREVNEELGLCEATDFEVSEAPLAHLEFDSWSESAGVETHYVMEVYEVIILNDAALGKVTGDSRNRWLSEREILSERAEDGNAVSPTMLRILGEMASNGGLAN